MLEKESKQFINKLQEIEELLELNIEEWTKDQKDAAKQTLNAVKIAYEGKNSLDRGKP